MLYTNLKHIESAAEYARIINASENVMIVFGRMDYVSILIYRIAEELEGEYNRVNFYDMEFDNPESGIIRNLPEVSGFMSIPFSIYYRSGKVVSTTSGIQSKAQITAILDKEFAVHVHA